MFSIEVEEEQGPLLEVELLLKIRMSEKRRFFLQPIMLEEVVEEEDEDEDVEEKVGEGTRLRGEETGEWDIIL